MSWELYRGELPGSLLVCHRCDNTLCVNPEHLFLGTHQDNMDDAKSKLRRRSWPRGEGHPKTAITEHDVREIRAYSRPALDEADRFGVTRRTIYNIRNFKTWGHVR